MSRDLLKEAIADAKAVKEAAIANAKAALEEAFTPQLKEMLAAKLETLDEGDYGDPTEEEAKKMGSMEEATLEEILAELEGISEDDEMKGPMEEAKGDSEEDSEEKPEGEEGDDDQKESEFTDEELAEINALIAAELENFMADEEGEMGSKDPMRAMDTADGEEDGNIDLTELMEELALEESMKEENPMEEGMMDMLGSIRAGGDYVQIAPMLLSVLGAAGLGGLINYILKNNPDVREKVEGLASGAAGAINRTTGTENPSSDTTKMSEELQEAYSTIETLRSDLNEVNLLNAKLLYTNKIFKAKNLTESQKVKVLSTFDKAETVNEVKLVFESLNTSLATQSTTKAPIKESMGFASKASGVVKNNQTIETDAVIARMKKLAGL